MKTDIRTLSCAWDVVRTDRLRGARELLLTALKSLDQYLTLNPGTDHSTLIDELSVLRREMVGFKNASKILKSEQNPINSVRKLIVYLESVSGKIGGVAEGYFKDKITVLCHSRSSIVEGVLSAMHDSGKIASIIQLESRPEYEGRVQAENLAARGMTITICADAAMALSVDRVDIILVGADAATSDGTFLGKAGCFPLALTAKSLGKPFYVATELLKFSEVLPQLDEINLGIDQVKVLWNVSEPAIKGFNPHFEYTPGHLVTGFITEQGTLTPPVRVPESLSF
jgi:translation initiation factor 2B subunit (eIF-2B alpha/beta/delta family)